MADISKIQVPGSTTQYNIKDAQARRDIEDVKADLNNMLPVLSGTNLFTKSLGSMPSAPITRNGVTITFIQPNAIVINGTATTSFNIELMSKSFLIPSPATLHHKIVSSSELKHSYWTPGYFKQDDSRVQYAAIKVVNTVVDYDYPSDAYSFRDFFHIESGDVFDNDAYMLIVTDRQIDDLGGQIDDLGGQIDDLGGQIDDIGGQIGLLITGKTWEASETKTSTGYVTLRYNPPIPKGTLLKSDLKNDSDIRNITWNIAGKDEAYQRVDTNIGTTNIVTAPFDIYFSKHYVNVSGSAFVHFTIETVKYLNKEEEEEDFNKNQFKIQFANTVSNGVTVTVVGKNKMRLNGTATAGFNLNFAFRTIDLSIVKKAKFFIQSTTTEGFYVQTGYFDYDDTARQMAQMIQPMTWTEVDFPSDAYTGRLYMHVNAETTFSDETITFYCYYVTDSDEEDTFDATLIFNGEPYTGQYDWQTPVVSYGKLFKGKSEVESFAFFTDPHVLGFADDNRNETRMENYFKRLQKTYNSTPCSFMVCGGDWLNNSTTMDEACYRLGYLRGIAKNMLDGCHLVMGNHDTNYQGKYDADSELRTGRLNDDTISSIMYRETPTQKAYYSFDGANSKCYILDTGIEHGTMLEYDWEQIDWLARRLKQDDHEHSIIFLHILYNTQGSTPVLGNLAEAYNSHTSITLNGTTYDFGNCTGKIELFIAGHTHTDSNGVLGGVPYFITASRAYNSDEPIIDLVLIDYVGRTVNLVRVGTLGSNRTLQLA